MLTLPERVFWSLILAMTVCGIFWLSSMGASLKQVLYLRFFLYAILIGVYPTIHPWLSGKSYTAHEKARMLWIRIAGALGFALLELTFF